MSEIGDRLKKYREAIPKTLDEMAAETGIPKSNLGYYETKGRGIPEDAREKLRAYGAPLAWILTGEGADPTLPIKEVSPGAIGGSNWSQLPEERQRAAVQRAVDRQEGGRGPRIDGATMEEAARLVESQILKGRQVSDSLRWNLIAVVSSELADLRALGKGEEILDRIRDWMSAAKAGLGE